MEPSLPSPDLFASMAVAVLFVIVLWDAFWLTRQRLDVPTLGELPNGGFAWESEGAQELIRQWGNLGSHLISLLVPKRYAVTRTHAFADGQRYEWQRLRLSKRQPTRRIMLLRKGWGIFGPLPLGGAQNDLSIARSRIELALDPDGKWPRDGPATSEEE